MRLLAKLTARVAAGGALLLALPAVAGAVVTPPTLSASVGTTKHYQVEFSASPYGAELDFARTLHGATQIHTLDNYSSTGVSYTAAADLSSAQIVAAWGSHGKVSMTFTPTGPAKQELPKGCTGRAALSRNGVLRGTLTAKLDKRFFKTFKRTSFKATLSQSGSFFCGTGGGGFGGPGLSILSAGKVGKLQVSFVRFGRGKVTENASVTQQSAAGNWILRHSISETASSSALKIAADASSASAKGAAPFLSGTLRFRALGTHTSTSATGSASGSFAAKFDSIGTQRLARGSTANVSQP